MRTPQMPGTSYEGFLIGVCVLPWLQLRLAEFLTVNAGLKFHKYLTRNYMSSDLAASDP